jgi:hypothetical protein
MKAAHKAVKVDPQATATGAQQVRIIKALRVGPKTSHDLRKLGVYHVAGRIKELRDEFGCHISTHPVTLIDGDGFSHRGCALYTLVTESTHSETLQ